MATITYNVSVNLTEKIPTKGQLIKLNNENTKYKILSYDRESHTAVLAWIDSNLSSILNSTLVTETFSDGKSYGKYDSSELDTFLNTTYYNSLSNSIKNAIVSHNVTLDAWIVNQPTASSQLSEYDFKLYTSQSDNDGTKYKKVAYKNIGNRNIYMPSIGQFWDYYNKPVSLYYNDVVSLLCKYTGNTSTNYSRLSDGYAVLNSGQVYPNYTSQGNLFVLQYKFKPDGTPDSSAFTNKGSYAYSESLPIIPIFDIDLSKVEYEII